jgi:hypothetical protein
LETPKFKNAHPAETETSIEELADVDFLKTLDAAKKNIIQEMVNESGKRLGPVIKVADTEVKNQKQLLILYMQGSTHSFFSSITDL